MDMRTKLLGEIEAFLKTHRITETTFGRMAVNDGKFMGRLRARKNITLDTVERVQRFLQEDIPHCKSIDHA
jgi:hypothetical protein